jgi:hypothetical protein
MTAKLIAFGTVRQIQKGVPDIIRKSKSINRESVAAFRKKSRC